MKLQTLIIGVGKKKPQFDGSIQKFKFNGNDIIKQCREDRLLPGKITKNIGQKIA